MRNYIFLKYQVSGFTLTFTGQLVIVIAIGEDDDDVGEVTNFMIGQAYEQFPGQDFGGEFRNEPSPIYVELNKHNVARAISTNIGAVIAQQFLSDPNVVSVSYAPGATDALDFSPAFFQTIITDLSPRKTWSHGH